MQRNQRRKTQQSADDRLPRFVTDVDGVFTKPLASIFCQLRLQDFPSILSLGFFSCIQFESVHICFF